VEGPEIIADAGQKNCCSNGVLNLNTTFNCLYQMVLNKYLNHNILRRFQNLRQSGIIKKML